MNPTVEKITQAKAKNVVILSKKLPAVLLVLRLSCWRIQHFLLGLTIEFIGHVNSQDGKYLL